MPLYRRKNGSEKKRKTVTPGSSPVKRTLSSKNLKSDDFPNGDLRVAEPVFNGPQQTSFQLHDLTESDGNETPLLTSSRLSKTIHEVLHDRDALPYFIQFLESAGDVHLLRFWLDVQSFVAASLTRIRTQSVQSARCKQNRKNAPKTICDNDPAKPIGDESTDDVDKTTIKYDVSAVLPQDGGFMRDDNVTRDSDTANGQICDTPSSISLTTLHFPEIDKKYNNTGASDDLIDRKSNYNEMLNNGSHASLQTASDNNNHTDITVTDATNTASSEDDLADKLQKSIARDAVTIYSKFISMDAPLLIDLPEDIRNDAISKICQEDGSVDVTCFAKCQQHVLDTLHTNYFDDFKRSVHHYKHQIDLLTSGKVYLADFLYNECAMFYLTEYLEQEGAQDLLQFVVSGDNFQQHLQKSLSSHNWEQAQDDAMVLYNKYFSLQATCPLGFSDKVRFDVESNICQETGPLPDCFAVARNIVLRYIEKMYFGDFLKSEIYYKYLTELINSVQLLEEPAVIRSKHRRTGSETSSEYSLGSHSTGAESLSTRNTLLASNDKHTKKQTTHRLDDISMDDAYLNPDQLWRRSNAGPLKLGQVDQMGRFTSYFQPEPNESKKKGSRFFKKNSEKLKEEEQMAVKIAQMIISDVTNITQRDAASVTQRDIAADQISPNKLDSTNSTTT